MIYARALRLAGLEVRMPQWLEAERLVAGEDLLPAVLVLLCVFEEPCDNNCDSMSRSLLHRYVRSRSLPLRHPGRARVDN